MLTAKQYQELSAKGGVNKKGRIVADEKTLDSMMKKPVVSPAPKAEKPVKKHKFGAVEETDEATGKKSKSKLQKKHESEYRLMLRNGLIACYCPEVEISLKSPRTGGIHTYECDHLLIHWDGSLEYIDSKGAITPEFKKKANWMERQFLPKMAENGVKVTFKARYAKEAHTYVSRPLKTRKARVTPTPS